MYEAFLIFYTNESEVLFLCLLLIRKKMYLIFSGMNEEAFCTLKLNKNKQMEVIYEEENGEGELRF